MTCRTVTYEIAVTHYQKWLRRGNLQLIKEAVPGVILRKIYLHFSPLRLPTILQLLQIANTNTVNDELGYLTPVQTVGHEAVYQSNHMQEYTPRWYSQKVPHRPLTFLDIWVLE